METSGWIKLHRKLAENEFLSRDPTALVIFVHLLLRCKRDGTVTLGRRQLEQWTSVTANTAWKALIRLEKQGVVDRYSNNRFTTVSICKWSNYQQDGDRSVDNQVTTEGQRKDNGRTLLQEERIKNKNTTPLPPKGSIDFLDDGRCAEIALAYSVRPKDVLERREDLRLYCGSKGKRYSDYYATLQGWVRRDIREGKLRKIAPSAPAPDYDEKPTVSYDTSEIRRNLSAKLAL